MELWIFLGVISAVGFALLSIIDRYFLNKDKKLVHPLIFGIATTYVYIVIMGLIFLLSPVEFILTKQLLWYIFIIGTLATLSRYGYYYALHHAEASYIAPFMKLITVFSVLTAYFLLGEPLSSKLLLGAVLIFIGGYFILEKQGKKWLYIPQIDFAVVMTIIYSLLVAFRGVADKIAVQTYEPFLIIILVQVYLLIADSILVLFFKREELLPFISYVKKNPNMLKLFVLKSLIFLVTFLSFYTGLEKGLLSKTLPLANIDAMFVAIFAVFLLKEKMSKQRIVGTILTILGAILVGLG